MNRFTFQIGSYTRARRWSVWILVQTGERASTSSGDLEGTSPSHVRHEGKPRPTDDQAVPVFSLSCVSCLASLTASFTASFYGAPAHPHKEKRHPPNFVLAAEAV